MNGPETSSTLPAYLEPLRDALVDARRRRATVSHDGLPEPRDDADAYAVQRAVGAALGWFAHAPPRAWKVGAGSRDAMPNAAPLPAEGVTPTPAVFARDAFNRILIEGEIAFRLRAPLESPHARGDAAVAAAIGEWLVTIEVVSPRYADFEATSVRLRLADQGVHGALVVGTGRTFPASVDWGSLVAIVRRDGEIVRQTRGGLPLGSPLFLLDWLATHAAERGMTLAAGDVITAGTWTGVLEALPGQAIDVEFPAVGHASARFA